VSNRGVRLWRTVIGNPLAIVLVVFLVGLGIWALSTRTQPHHVYASIENSFGLTPGLDVKINGLDAGKIAKVQYQNGEALVKFGVYSKYWPLHAGTTIVTRWGTSIGDGTRYIQVDPGPTSAPTIPDGGIIGTQYTTPAVNLDEIENVFNGPTRNDVAGLTQNLSTSLQGHTGQLNAGIGATAPALTAAQGLFNDIDADKAGLKSLITNANTLTRIIAQRSTAVSDLVTVAAKTLNTFATNTRGVQGSIQNLPATLVDARGTLSQLDTSVGYLRTLVTALAPGAAKLPGLAKPATAAIHDLQLALPSTTSMVRTVTNAAPSLTNLLNIGSPFIKTTGTDVSNLTPMFACMRPYTPELGSALVGLDGWVQDYSLSPPNEGGLPGYPTIYPQSQTNGLARVHTLAAMPEVGTNSLNALLPNVVTPSLYSTLSFEKYAFPRPPGLDEGQPWYQPNCGITAAGINPAVAPTGDFGDGK
jgi:ABC-type transporter Mla subunit MlaD